VKHVHQDELKNNIEYGEHHLQVAIEEQRIERIAAVHIADLSYKIVKAVHRYDKAIVETQHRSEQGYYCK
jgi:hypothetical protein